MKEKVSVEFSRTSFFWGLIGFFVIGILFSSYFLN